MRRKKDKSNGITALYERLSRDDDNAGESNSIVHQKQMLEDYAMKHGFTNLVHFTDDGYIINKQYSYAEGYVTEQSHGGADISSERRSIFLYDKVKDDEIEITVFSRYIDKNTYLKVQYLPHTKYGAIVEIK